MLCRLMSVHNMYICISYLCNACALVNFVSFFVKGVGAFFVLSADLNHILGCLAFTV